MSDKTILCFGDSNTHGSMALPDWNASGRFPKHQRWPNIMAAHLGASWDVIAEGHPGRNAAFDDPIEGDHKNGLRILPALLQSHKPIDLLILMLGTNDLKARFNVPPIDIALAIERLVVQNRMYLSGPGGTESQVLIVAPVPIKEVGFLGEIFAGGAAKSRELPDYLEQIAARQGANFLNLADVAQVDIVDGVHLTANGQTAVADAITAKVRQIFADS